MVPSSTPAGTGGGGGGAGSGVNVLPRKTPKPECPPHSSAPSTSLPSEPDQPRYAPLTGSARLSQADPMSRPMYLPPPMVLVARKKPIAVCWVYLHVDFVWL